MASAHSVEQLGDADAEPMRKTGEDPHSRIALSPLDPTDVGQGEATGVGYLLLREAAFGADSERAPEDSNL